MRDSRKSRQAMMTLIKDPKQRAGRSGKRKLQRAQNRLNHRTRKLASRKRQLARSEGKMQRDEVREGAKLKALSADEAARLSAAGVKLSAAEQKIRADRKVAQAKAAAAAAARAEEFKRESDNAAKAVQKLSAGIQIDEKMMAAASKRLMTKGKDQGALSAQLAEANARVLKMKKTLGHLIMDASIAGNQTSLIHAHRVAQLKAQEQSIATKQQIAHARAAQDKKEAGALRAKIAHWKAKKNRAKVIKYQALYKGKLNAMQNSAKKAQSLSAKALRGIEVLKVALSRAEVEAAVAEQAASKADTARNAKASTALSTVLVAMATNERSLSALFAAATSADDQELQAAVNAAEGRALADASRDTARAKKANLAKQAVFVKGIVTRAKAADATKLAAEKAAEKGSSAKAKTLLKQQEAKTEAKLVNEAGKANKAITALKADLKRADLQAAAAKSSAATQDKFSAARAVSAAASRKKLQDLSIRMTQQGKALLRDVKKVIKSNAVEELVLLKKLLAVRAAGETGAATRMDLMESADESAGAGAEARAEAASKTAEAAAFATKEAHLLQLYQAATKASQSTESAFESGTASMRAFFRKRIAGLVVVQAANGKELRRAKAANAGGLAGWKKSRAEATRLRAAASKASKASKFDADFMLHAAKQQVMRISNNSQS